MNLLAAVHDSRDATEVVYIVLLLLAAVCFIGSAFTAYRRDFPVSIALFLIALVLFFVAV